MRPVIRGTLPRSVKLAAVAIVLGSLGCGDNERPSGAPSSGSRLRLVRYIYEDGTAQWDRTTFYDAQRSERCTPEVWSDGDRYCTPVAGDAIYVDDTCTQEVGRITAGVTPAYFAQPFSIRGAMFPSRLYTVGAAVTAPAQSWVLHDGTCVGPSSEAGNFDYYALGDPIERTALVRVKRADPIGNAQLQLVRDTSDDGLDVPVALHDRSLALDCLPRSHPDQPTTECAPTGAATAEYFHDTACSQLEVAADAFAIPVSIASLSDATGCWSDFAVGDQVGSDPLYAAIGSTCFETPAPDGDEFFVAGDPLTLAMVTRVVDTISGRRLQSIELAEGELADDLLHDTMLGADCARTQLADAIRCVPVTAATVVPLFADAQCSTAIDVALVPSGACDPPAPFAAAATGELHAVGAVHATQLYEPSTGEICAPYAVPARREVHDVGPALPESAFVAATVTDD